jgi:hypothetical protein
VDNGLLDGSLGFGWCRCISGHSEATSSLVDSLQA